MCGSSRTQFHFNVLPPSLEGVPNYRSAHCLVLREAFLYCDTYCSMHDMFSCVEIMQIAPCIEIRTYMWYSMYVLLRCTLYHVSRGTMCWLWWFGSTLLRHTQLGQCLPVFVRVYVCVLLCTVCMAGGRGMPMTTTYHAEQVCRYVE